MDAKDFMPDDAAIAGIRKDIEQYESQRASAFAQVRWRVPVFFGALLALAAILAYAFNSFADPNEQWFSSPHVFLDFGTFAVGIFFVYGVGDEARRLQLRQSFRERVLPLVLRLHPGDIRYAQRHHARLLRSGCPVGGRQAAFNRRSFDDLVAGKYVGFPVRASTKPTSRKRPGKSKSQTVFQGRGCSVRDDYLRFQACWSRRGAPDRVFQILPRHVRHGRAGGGF